MYIPNLNPKNYGTDRFFSSKDLWNENGRTIIFFGDVWFSENCIKKIFNYKKRKWVIFSRTNASKITGKRYGEIFAFSFYNENNEYLLSCLHKTLNAYIEKKIRRCQGWHLYRVLSGIKPLNKHIIKGNIINIDDFTDDFDFPEDYETWMKNRKEWKKQKFELLTIGKIR